MRAEGLSSAPARDGHNYLRGGLGWHPWDHGTRTVDARERITSILSEDFLYDFKGGSLRSPPAAPRRAAGARKLASSPARAALARSAALAGRRAIASPTPARAPR
jgi:hypothetical protein